MKKIITIGILCIAMTTMVACKSENETDTGTTNQDPSQEAVQEPLQEPLQELEQDPLLEPAQDPATIEETVPATNDSNTSEAPAVVGENTLEKYAGLIGLSRDKVIETVGEEPTVIDEGGLDFEKAGIRIWFESDSKTVNQIFTQDKTLDFDGVKIGDKIDQFKTVFGTPVLEDTSSAFSNFDYNGLVLHIEYDSSSKAAYAVYLLKEWQ